MKRQYTSTLQRWILTEALKAGADGISRLHVYRGYYKTKNAQFKHKLDLNRSLKHLRERGLILHPTKIPRKIILSPLGREKALEITIAKKSNGQN